MRILRYMLLAALVPIALFFAVGLLYAHSDYHTRLPVQDPAAVWQRLSTPQQLGRLVGEPVRLREDGILAWQLLDDRGQPRARLQLLKLEPGRSIRYRVDSDTMHSEGLLELSRDPEGRLWLESRQQVRGKSLFWRAVLKLSTDTLVTRHRADLLRILAGEIDPKSAENTNPASRPASQTPEKQE